MPEFLIPVLGWIDAHPGWAGFILFLIACAESLALVGLFVPGAVLMFGAGALIATGRLEFWPLMIWAAAGAVVGDGVSFLLGRYFGARLTGMWPFRTHPALLQRAVDFFQAHGGKSVALGRFIGPIRPVIPAVAGMLGMSAPRFIIINVISALLWAPAYLLPGMAFGASLALAAEVMTRLVVLAGLILVLAWVLYRITHRSLRRILLVLTLIAVLVLAAVLGVRTALDRQEWAAEGIRTEADWRTEPWRDLPRRRQGLFGGEAFSLQLAASEPELQDALQADGWRRVGRVGVEGILNWLSPRVVPERMAVLPHWHLGKMPDLTAVRQTGPQARWVLRAWRSGSILALGERPIWLVTLDYERLKPGPLWVSADHPEAMDVSLAAQITELAAQLDGRVIAREPEQQHLLME